MLEIWLLNKVRFILIFLKLEGEALSRSKYFIKQLLDFQDKTPDQEILCLSIHCSCRQVLGVP